MKAAFSIRSALPRQRASRPASSGERWWSLLAGVTAWIALGAPALAQTAHPLAPAQAARYPLDPVCPWGRLADGHGLLVRCLGRGEAQALSSGVPAGTAPAAPPAAPAPHGAVTPPAPAAPLAPAAAPGTAAPGTTAPPAAGSSTAAAPGAVPPIYLPPSLQSTAAPPAAAAAPATAAQAAAPTATAAPAGTPPPSTAAAAPSAAAPSVAAATPAAATPATTPATPPRSTKIYRKVSVREVGPAIADTGELPEAHVQLRRVNDRYAQCVANNGGLEGEQGRVTVRFLVRERGRAEGVAVKERQGVSLAAAKCVAEVVDRRFVGYPAAPIVGATLSIDFIPEGAAR